MSAPDQGDDDKGFLARWSQRKRGAEQPERDAPLADAEVGAEPAPEAESPEEFDLSSLPSLDELRAKLLGMIQTPATRIAGVVAAPASQLARVFAAYAKKDEAA